MGDATQCPRCGRLDDRMWSDLCPSCYCATYGNVDVAMSEADALAVARARIEQLVAERDAARATLDHAEARELALAKRLDAALAEAAEAEEEERAVYERVLKDANTEIMAIIGACGNHLWGPALEDLCRIVRTGMMRAAEAERERDDERAKTLAEVSAWLRSLDEGVGDLRGSYDRLADALASGALGKEETQRDVAQRAARVWKALARRMRVERHQLEGCNAGGDEGRS